MDDREKEIFRGMIAREAFWPGCGTDLRDPVQPISTCQVEVPERGM
jgi:hypothetical protein